jgi:hypothetical protein
LPAAEPDAPRTTADVPRLLLIVAGVVAVVGCSMSIVGAVTTGIFGDDPAHVERLTEFLDSGRYVIKDELAVVAPGAIPDNAYVYGPVTAVLGHAANVLVGNEQAGEIERTPQAYTVRHLVVAGFGLVGLASAAVLGGIVLGGWRWGVVVAGVLAAIPMWTGNAMFNLKDTPVAAGHTLATLGLVLIACSGARERRRGLYAGSLLLTLGIVVMMGSRPGMWVSLAVSLVVFAGTVMWSRTPPRRALCAAGAAVVASYLALLAIYPVVFAHPVTMLWKSATTSADFAYGRLAAAHAESTYEANGRLYQVEQMLQIWPLILLGFLAVGLVVGVRRSMGLLKTHSPSAAMWLLVGAQAVALPILITVHKSDLANGLRQTLFVVPAQAVLVGVGFAAVIGGLPSGRGRARRVGVVTVAAVGLILPTVVQLSMFPYQYSQLNVAGEWWDNGGEISKYEADQDYFKTSYRELDPAVSARVKVVCPAWIEKGQVPQRGDNDCRTRTWGSLSAYWRFAGRSSSDHPKSGEFYAMLRGALGVPRNCTEVASVTRWQNLRRVTMSRLLECH